MEGRQTLGAPRTAGPRCDAQSPAGPGRALALSHHSALAVQGVPVHGVDERVHLVRTDGGRGRTAPGLQVHAAVPAAFVREVDGLPVVAPALACLQVADAFGVVAGLVSADGGLHGGTFAADEIALALEQGRFGRGAPAARLVAGLADGPVESPGDPGTLAVSRAGPAGAAAAGPDRRCGRRCRRAGRLPLRPAAHRRRVRRPRDEPLPPGRAATGSAAGGSVVRRGGLQTSRGGGCRCVPPGTLQRDLVGVLPAGTVLPSNDRWSSACPWRADRRPRSTGDPHR